MRRSLSIILVVLLLMLVLPASVSAQAPPQLPARYWGAVTVYKQAQEVGAPIGTIITALVDEVERGSITVTEPGKYGGSTGLDPKLSVQGDIPGGSLVEFYVNSVKADQTASFQNDHPEEVNLSVEDLIEPAITNLSPAPDETVGVATPTISAGYSDALSGIDIATAKIEVDSLDVTESASVTERGVSYTPTAALPNGTYAVKVTVADKLGNSTSREWSFTISVVVVGGGGGGGGIPLPTGEEVETNLFGTEESFPISSSGEMLETIEATSEDENVTMTITIETGTIALLEGEPLETLTAEVDTSPPPPPEDTSIIGLVYDFGPDEATFDPPITLTRSYDPNDIPGGVAEEDLVLAWYDEAADTWVELDCIVDTENNTITASIGHFTTFAIIGAVIPSEPLEPALAPAPAAFTPSSLRLSPVEVNIGDEVTISLFVVNTGGESGSYEVTLKIDGVVAATKEVTVSAGFSKEVIFTISKDIAGTYSVDVNGLTDSFTVKEKGTAVIPTPPTSSSDEETSLSPPAEETSPPPPAEEINWPILGGVIGGVLVIGLLIFFLVRRRAY